MDKRTLIAITLCFLIFAGWQKLYLEPRVPQQPNPQQGQASSKQTTSSAQVPSSSPAPSSGAALQSGQSGQPSQAHLGAGQNSKNISEKSSSFSGAPAGKGQEVRQDIALQESQAVVNDSGGFFHNWSLENYRQAKDSNSPKVNLSQVTLEPDQVHLAFDATSFSYLSQVQGRWESGSVQQGAQTIEQQKWLYEDPNVRLSRVFSFHPEQPYVDVWVEAKFLGKDRPKYAFVSLSAQTLGKDDPEAMDRKLIFSSEGSTEEALLSDEVEFLSYPHPVDWIAATTRYFALAVVPQAGAPHGLVQPLGHPLGLNRGRLSLVYPVTADQISIPLRAYFGPKEINRLNNVSPKLEPLVDYGWFTGVAHLCLQVLKWFYQYSHNYGIAIILLTFVVKVLTFPLTYKSMKSMKKMAQYAPELKKLQEKYKDNRDALNREMMVFMREKGYNPFAGCWPIMIQMPIFIALYRVLYSSVELYQAPFALWIDDLSLKDPYYVFPILVGLTWWAQQRLTPQTITDPTQQKIMQLMPLIFTLFMLTLPSGLGLYFLTNAILSIVQQLLLNRKLDGKSVGNAQVVTA